MTLQVDAHTEGAAEVLARTIAAVVEGIDNGLHVGAQIAVDLSGRDPIGFSIGEAAPGVPMTADSMMPWFSMTKPTVAVSAMQQWDKGAFDLDDPVATYIPEFAANGKDRITIRQLFTHTAGIRGADAVDPGMDVTAGADAVWAAMVDKVCGIEPEAGWVPGRRAGYHLGSTMLLLAELVRRVDGRPFDRYVRDEVFTPLGMDDCWVGMPRARFEEYGERMGVMQLTSAGAPMPFPILNGAEWAELVVPGGGGRGPMREITRLYAAMRGRGELDGHRLLSRAVVEAMTARHRVGYFDETFGIDVDWGLGFMIDAISYGRHCSPRSFGHGGMQSSCSYCDPDEGLVVAMVFNGMPGNKPHYRRLEQVSTAIYEDLGLAPVGAPGRDHPCPDVALG